MRIRLKWAIGVLTILLVTSLAFNLYYTSTTHFDKMQAQANFMQGEGFIMEADSLLEKNRNTFRAGILAYEGIGYLRASGQALETQQGIKNVYGLADFLDQAMYNLLGHWDPGQSISTATLLHKQHVIQVFVKTTKPLEMINYGSISNSALQQALNQTFQAMTSQERNQFQSN